MEFRATFLGLFFGMWLYVIYLFVKYHRSSQPWLWLWLWSCGHKISKSGMPTFWWLNPHFSWSLSQFLMVTSQHLVKSSIIILNLWSVLVKSPLNPKNGVPFFFKQIFLHIIPPKIMYTYDHFPIQEDYFQNIHHINPAYELCMKPYNMIQAFHKQIFTVYSCNKLE